MKFCIGPQILSNNCTDSCFKMFLARKLFLNIGGHGFWDKGGVNTRGCPQKNFPAAFGGRKIFSPAPPPGGEKFFPVGCLFSRPGGDFAKKMEKMASPGGQKIFFPWCFAFIFAILRLRHEGRTQKVHALISWIMSFTDTIHVNLDS